MKSSHAIIKLKLNIKKRNHIRIIIDQT